MLEIINPDEYGIEMWGSPEWLDFWEEAKSFALEDLLSWLDEERLSACEELVKDVKRLTKQRDNLISIMPHKTHQIKLEASQAINKIEKQIAKIGGKSLKHTQSYDV